jgi:hypothetical protein
MLTMNTIVKAGVIQVKEVRGKWKLYAHNFQRGGRRHIGTKSGCVYEKEAQLYRKYDTYNLTQSEYGVIRDLETGFIRIVDGGTYSISVADFDKHKIPVYDPHYGAQWGCERQYFQFTPVIQKRNAVLDNPPLEVSAPLIREKQLGLFGYGVGERGGNDY